MVEFIFEYKCKCNDKMNSLSRGEQEIDKIPDIGNPVCPECGQKIKITNIKKINIEKIEKEKGSSKIISEETINEFK